MAAITAGRRGKGLRRLAQTGMAAASDETLDAIKLLHPEGAPVIAPAGTLPEAPRITGLMIAASVNRLIQRQHLVLSTCELNICYSRSAEAAKNNCI